MVISSLPVKSKELLSMVAVMLCVGLIIIRHFLNVCKKLTKYTDIYDIKSRFQNFMRAINNWMADRSLDTPNLKLGDQPLVSAETEFIHWCMIGINSLQNRCIAWLATISH